MGTYKKSKQYYRKFTRRSSGNFMIAFVLGLIGLFMMLPLILSVMNAFKPLEELFLFPPRFFVRNPTFRNFSSLFKLADNLWVPFTRYFYNSLFITTVGSAGNIILASMAAYPLAKIRFPGSKWMFNMVTWSLLFTGTTTIPTYVVMTRLHIINTVWSLLLPAFASSLGLFLMKQSMITIPDDTLDSVRLDGAGEMRIFWSIVMPSVKPSWITLIIFSVQGLWNLDSSAFIFDEKLKTVPAILGQIVSGGIARQGVGAAAAVLMMVIPVTVFLVSQSNVIETMAHSGIKG